MQVSFFIWDPIEEKAIKDNLDYSGLLLYMLQVPEGDMQFCIVYLKATSDKIDHGYCFYLAGLR